MTANNDNNNSSASDVSPDIPGIDESPANTDVGDYPAHTQAFETYYWLGDNRRVRKAALIRFQEQYPNIPKDTPEFTRRFESFYVGMKRYSNRENWKAWVIKKDQVERQKRDKELTERVIASQKNIIGYRGTLQQGIFAFSRKATYSAKIIVELVQLGERLLTGIPPGASREQVDAWPEERRRIQSRRDELEEELLRTGVQIRDYRELKECIELDVELGKLTQEIPQSAISDRDVMGEGMSEQLDKLVEFLKRRSGDAMLLPKRGSEDAGGHNEDDDRD